MKKITLLLMLTISTVSFSQTINGTPLKDIEVDYMQIVGTSKLLSKKVSINIDFGQSQKLIQSSKKTAVLDSDGKKVAFNSMIDALNFFSKNGYEFVNAYVITIGSQNVYHYMLKRIK